MSTVKSLAVGDGDMFYIKHGSDNFTIIDCRLSAENKDEILKEIKAESAGKGITRFVSTHPDEDHLQGLLDLDDALGLVNFYCVKNQATKSSPSESFKRYCKLRDDKKKAFYLYKGCSRKWMNESDNERDSAGLFCLWPITSNKHYQDVLAAAKRGGSPNNLSCILKYSLKEGAKFLWMGDLETDFMEKIEDAISFDPADILFAPHHGRESGKVINGWLKEIDPQIIIIGEAPSKHLNYYEGYDTITQSSAGDIMFDCVSGKTHIYVSNPNYSVSFLVNEMQADKAGLHYLGTLPCRVLAST